MIKPQDLIAAATPPIATITISQINSFLGFVTGVLSLTYLIWRWRRDWLAEKRKYRD